jgi:hypothetical protein
MSMPFRVDKTFAVVATLSASRPEADPSKRSNSLASKNRAENNDPFNISSLEVDANPSALCV